VPPIFFFCISIKRLILERLADDRDELMLPAVRALANICSLNFIYFLKCLSFIFMSSSRFFLPPIPVAMRSKAWVCGRSLARIVGSNPAGVMDVCLL
jgi:hypothetical protein